MTQPILTLEWVQSERARLKARLNDLDAVERVIRDASVTPEPERKAGGGQLRRIPLLAVPSASKKRVLLQAIADAEEGLSTQAVIAAGTASGLKDLKTDNTSPQLSGARADGLLILDGSLWKITPKGQAYLAGKA